MAGQRDTLSENKSYIGTLMAVLRLSLGVCATARAGSVTRGLGLKTNGKIFFESMICAITWKACIKREGLTFHILCCTAVPGRFNILHTKLHSSGSARSSIGSVLDSHHRRDIKQASRCKRFTV